MLVQTIQAFLLPGVLLAGMIVITWGRVPDNMKKESEQFGGLPGVLTITILLWPFVLAAAIKKNK
ncbi:hypothetical protein PP460_gp071 [Streptomyces phage Muntaha]|uniref:Uncharacterized protein n=1 Tax=Streptomyces phage Muntaha TaxID=2713269 RepID=A0A6G8R3H8_9CAUD|nr:hypothetical protein PP460_gp071 [Streptomyces phage Muntaha]QIN94731.1 hypothetical protein SEA_MUNTAHA_207 [Streptomyces phage Muntaha]